jgi:hypothetical protein
MIDGAGITALIMGFAAKSTFVSKSYFRAFFAFTSFLELISDGLKGDGKARVFSFPFL